MGMWRICGLRESVGPANGLGLRMRVLWGSSVGLGGGLDDPWDRRGSGDWGGSGI